MRIVAVSDLHGKINQVEFPPGDVLVMAGDLLPNKPYDVSNTKYQLDYLPRFDEALAKLPYKKKFVIPGNHDFAFQYEKSAPSLITNGTVLIDQAAEFEGVKFYGSPWQVWFHDWAFNFPEFDDLADYEVARKTWAKIPDDTNVLVVHGPPHYTLDECADGRRVGCPALKQRIAQLKALKLGVYGHIHESYGRMEQDGVCHINASICTLKYNPTNAPQVFDL